MRVSPKTWRRACLWTSLVLFGGAAAHGCSLESEGGLAPGASAGGAGGDASASGRSQDDARPDTANPDVPCFPPNKICGGTCVSFDDADYGCRQDTCDPCEAWPNAKVGCVNNECQPTGCATSWGDCDADPLNGCETPLTTLDNCGGCGDRCSLPHAVSECSSGQCLIDHCLEDEIGPTWSDCNQNAADGCEQNLRTLEYCGGCDVPPCRVSSGKPTCVTGICRIDDCEAGKADCNAEVSDGCETDLTSTLDCGACRNTCAADNVSAWKCVAGACDIVSCVSPWLDCDGNDTNGCEVNSLTDVNHCGGCGAKCELGVPSQVKSRSCDDGLCVPNCKSNFGNCNGNQDGSTDDGCETDLRTKENCGACGVRCHLDHAIEDCSQGTCILQQCVSNWSNCDNSPANGCETSLSTLKNCGACLKECSLPHASESCSKGECFMTSCNANWGNCDNQISNGCETSLLSTSNCGGCGVICDIPDASESCSTSTCR